ncbi:unnamed protein product [Peronospora effusa]|nr:unnamed protein product [Peronospora effusa]
MPNGVAIAAVTPLPNVAPSATLDIKIPRIDAQNSRNLSAKTPLANQFASTMAGPNVSASSQLDPTLVEEMQQDVRFFQEQNRRLKQELDALDTEGQS